MKIEIGENLAFLLSLIMVVGSICFGTIKGCSIVENGKVEAIKAGLVEKPIEGSQRTIWTKPETE